jgi:hypothetical protein
MKVSQYYKRIIYAVCAFLFVIIDWTRGSQVGSTWAWTVNCLGVLLCIILLTTDGWILKSKKETAIALIVLPIILVIGYTWWNNHQVVIYRDKLLTALINVWIMIICGIHLWKKKSHFRKAYSPLAIMTILLFAMMFLSVNEDFWPFWFGILFLLVYGWGIEESEIPQIVNGLIDGIMLSFFPLQAAAFVFRPYDNENYRYLGIYSNANMNALFYCIVLVASLIRLFQLRRKNQSKWKKVIFFLYSVALFAFILLTLSKTAWVAVFACLVVYVFVVDAKQLEKKAGWIIRQILIWFVAVIIMVPLVYLPVRYIPPFFHHPIWYEGEYAEWRIHSWDPVDSEKYVSFEELCSGISNRLEPIVNRILHNNAGLQKVVAAEDDFNPYGITVRDKFYPYDDEYTQRYSSYLGRLAIWDYYISHGNLKGHSNQDGHKVGIGLVYVWHSQNLFLQIWYYYGVLSGILLVLILIGAIAKAYKRALGEDLNYAGVFVALYLTLFVLYGLFEAVWYPGQAILTLAVFTPVLLSEKKTSNVELVENEEIANSSL